MTRKQMKYMSDALIYISAIAETMAKQLLIEQEISKMPPINIACIDLKNIKEAFRDVDTL